MERGLHVGQVILQDGLEHLDGVVHVGRHLGELVIGQCDLCVLGDAAHVFLAECHRRSLPHNR